MQLSSADQHHLSTIRENTRGILAQAIGQDTEHCILLDTPRHQNSGDSLIWLGELTYLSDLGVKVTYQTDMGRYFHEDLRRFPATTPILMHGGGNLGDIYPLHDAFRRFIVRHFANRRLIVLPQSLQYNDPGHAAEAHQDYITGTRLTILLRDTQSLFRASTALPGVDVRFCNDMAFGAPLEGQVHREPKDLLVLNRKDGETATSHSQPDMDHTDWSFTALSNLRWKHAIAQGAIYRRSPKLARRALYPTSQRANIMCMKLNVNSAVRQFTRARVVATNRLHAHVLATLLGIPHVVTDNSYGKISALYRDYSGQFETAHWASTLDESITEARRIMSRIHSTES